jgi:FkbM family methyltransferase
MRGLVRSVLRRLGYDIHRYVDDPYPGRPDPFLQQKALLSGKERGIVIFDIGAHRGLVSAAYRELFPAAAIYAFEPFPDNFKELQLLAAADNLFYPFPFACSVGTGRVRFNVNADTATNSLLITDALGPSYWGGHLLKTVNQIEVEATSIDTFCQLKQIDHIDILKIDTQGSEKLVLEGTQAMLRQRRVGMIYAEMLLVPTYQGQGKFHEVLKMLDDWGYTLFSIYNLEFRESSNRLLQVDNIFVPM